MSVLGTTKHSQATALTLGNKVVLCYIVLYQAYPDSLGVTVCGKCYWLRCNKLWKLPCDTATWLAMV